MEQGLQKWSRGIDGEHCAERPSISETSGNVVETKTLLNSDS